MLAAQALEQRPLAGAFTPAAAFDPDFVLGIQGVERSDLADDGSQESAWEKSDEKE